MSNQITTKEFIKFLEKMGFEHLRTKGSHRQYIKKGVRRPIVVDMQLKNVSRDHLATNLKTLGISYSEFVVLIKKA